ncbi:hypothetical protein VNO77_19492 [Canavalia gladiata]|uniref:Uncharacterized protein n=1 Tax=Canavalia gladiata TaxID=3824 RepID=A0AAN9LSP2_CANGL
MLKTGFELQVPALCGHFEGHGIAWIPRSTILALVCYWLRLAMTTQAGVEGNVIGGGNQERTPLFLYQSQCDLSLDMHGVSLCVAHIPFQRSSDVINKSPAACTSRMPASGLLTEHDNTRPGLCCLSVLSLESYNPKLSSDFWLALCGILSKPASRVLCGILLQRNASWSPLLMWCCSSKPQEVVPPISSCPRNLFFY